MRAMLAVTRPAFKQVPATPRPRRHGTRSVCLTRGLPLGAQSRSLQRGHPSQTVRAVGELAVDALDLPALQASRKLVRHVGHDVPFEKAPQPVKHDCLPVLYMWRTRGSLKDERSMISINRCGCRTSLQTRQWRPGFARAFASAGRNCLRRCENVHSRLASAFAEGAPDRRRRGSSRLRRAE
jgi:hypothetical protein